MRRLRTDRPILLARAAMAVAVFSALSVLMAAVLMRFSLVPVPEALAALGAGLMLALVAAALSVAAFVVIWRRGVSGTGRALAALAVSLALWALPVATFVQAIGRPILNDITTDLADPPPLTAAARDRAPDANPVAYPPEAAARQRASYPEIGPILVELPPDATQAAIRAMVTERGWTILAEQPAALAPENGAAPATGAGGSLEAVARSPLLGFPDDVVFRLTETAAGTRVDMRSASRYGTSDFGANADRVTHFLEELRLRSLIQ